MKTFILLHIIAFLFYATGIIWAFVDFMIYLFKDDPFNWISVILIGLGLVFITLNFWIHIKFMK